MAVCLVKTVTCLLWTDEPFPFCSSSEEQMIRRFGRHITVITLINRCTTVGYRSQLVQHWFWCIDYIVPSEAPYIIVMARLEGVGGKAIGWSMSAFSQLVDIAAISHGLGCNMGGATWSSRMGRCTDIAKCSFCGIITMVGRGLRTELRVCTRQYPVTCSTVSFLDKHDDDVMDWPGMSRHEPNRTFLGQKSIWVRDMGRPPSNQPELRQAVHQARRAVWVRRVRTLVESMPRRLWASLAAAVGHARCQS